MLTQRILTALILIPLTIWFVVDASPLCFSIITGIVMLYAAWEWTGLMGVSSIALRLGYVVLLAMLGFVSQWLPLGIFALIGFIWWFFAIFVLRRYSQGNSKGLTGHFNQGFIGLLILLPCYLSLLILHAAHYGVGLILILLLLVAATDSGAYFAGRWFGKHKLAPSISPGKTIEGVIGGVVVMLICVFIASLFLSYNMMDTLVLLAISIITALFSVVGDLTESIFKRIRGAKDSGNILPGHGGVLDRMDSYTAAAPVFTIGLLVSGLLT